MKKIGLLLLGLVIYVPKLEAQPAKEPYVMFLTMYVDPIPGHSQQLIEGVKMHNARFHAEDGNRAYLWSIVTGPRSGQFMWGRGPVTYDVMDNPLGEDHSKDWDANVAAHCRNVDDLRLWRRNDALTYNPENQVFSNNVLAKMIELNAKVESTTNVQDAMGKIAEVFRAKKYPVARRVYLSEFKSESGIDVMLIYPFASWTEFEKGKGLPPEFQEDYETVHGPGSYQKLVDILDTHTDGWYDEVRVMVE